MATKKVIRMSLAKSTKNKHVYNEDDEGQTIPSVYIDKNALTDPPPDKIRLTLEF